MYRSEQIALLEDIAKSLKTLSKLTTKLSNYRNSNESEVEVLDRVLKQALKTLCQACCGRGQMYNETCRVCGGYGEHAYDPKEEATKNVLES